jgi:rubredoxin
MTWKCPACEASISHDGEVMPNFGMIYRCHICRLELVFDPVTGQLTLAPLPPSDMPKSAA